MCNNLIKFRAVLCLLIEFGQIQLRLGFIESWQDFLRANIRFEQFSSIKSLGLTVIIESYLGYLY